MSAPRPSFAATKHRALWREQPLAAYLELTYRCNWRCVFCYNPRHHDRRRLEASEWRMVLDDLRELGTLIVTLTGGEPLTHPEFLEIAAAVRERSMAFKLFTNGALITDALAERLAALQPTAVELSLHGATAEVHERATAAPGSFDAVWRSVARLRRQDVPVVVKVLLTRENAHQLDEMVNRVAASGLPLRIDWSVTPRDDGDKTPLAHRASREDVARAMRRLHEVGQLPLQTGREETGVNCGLGRVTMAIDPEGDVYPCMQWRQSSLGNVRDIRLVDMWRSSPARREVAEVAVQANQRVLALGGAAARYSFCPALAFAHTGDPLTPDAPFLENAVLAEAVRAEKGAPITKD